MSDLTAETIILMIVIIFFVAPIVVALIIIWVILKSSKKKDNNVNYYIPPVNTDYQHTQYRPQQNYQKVQSVAPQNTYNYRPQTSYVPPVSNYPPRNNNQRYVSPQYTNQNNNQNFPYQAVNLLTKREHSFFKALKVIADKNNMDVLMKIRLADLVKVKDSIHKNEFYKYFNKISAKHIDFALIDNTKVVVLIELDDSTHNRKDRIERDNFVNETVTKCGYKIIHTYGDTKQIEDTIIQYKKSNIGAIG